MPFYFHSCLSTHVKNHALAQYVDQAVSHPTNFEPCPPMGSRPHGPMGLWPHGLPQGPVHPEQVAVCWWQLWEVVFSKLLQIITDIDVLPTASLEEQAIGSANFFHSLVVHFHSPDSARAQMLANITIILWNTSMGPHRACGISLDPA